MSAHRQSDAPVTVRHPGGRYTAFGQGSVVPSGVGGALIEAQEAAVSGDLIEVVCSATTASPIGKDGVHYWFAPGVTVANSVSDMFSDSGSAKSFVVDGFGVFNASGAGNRVLNLTAASTVYMRGKTATSAAGVGFRTAHASAVLTTDFDFYQSDDGTLDNVTAGGIIRCFGRRALSAGFVVENDGGTIECYIKEIESTGDIPVTNATGDFVGVYGSRIIAPAGSVAAQDDLSGSGANLLLVNCIIESDQTNPVFHATCVNTVREDGSAMGTNAFYLGPKVTTYTATNVTTDRSYDADTVAVAELADVVGTLIADLRTLGLIA